MNAIKAYVALADGYWQGRIKLLGEKSVPIVLHELQIALGLQWKWTRCCTVNVRRLPGWCVAIFRTFPSYACVIYWWPHEISKLFEVKPLLLTVQLVTTGRPRRPPPPPPRAEAEYWKSRVYSILSRDSPYSCSAERNLFCVWLFARNAHVVSDEEYRLYIYGLFRERIDRRWRLQSSVFLRLCRPHTQRYAVPWHQSWRDIIRQEYHGAWHSNSSLTNKG
jgi:hypothetical protein